MLLLLPFGPDKLNIYYFITFPTSLFQKNCPFHLHTYTIQIGSNMSCNECKRKCIYVNENSEQNIVFFEKALAKLALQ